MASKPTNKPRVKTARIGVPRELVERSVASTLVVDLPGPKFRGLRQHGVVYASLTDVKAFLDKTAQAFDDAGANADIGKSFRACRKVIEDADSIEVES